MKKKRNFLYEVAYSKNGHAFHMFRVLKTFEVAYSSLCDLIYQHRRLHSLTVCYHPEIEYAIKVIDLDNNQSYYLKTFTVQY